MKVPPDAHAVTKARAVAVVAMVPPVGTSRLAVGTDHGQESDAGG